MDVKQRILFLIATAILSATASLAEVKTDYDRSSGFSEYKTYCWKNIHTQNPLWADRIKAAVNSALAAKGWTEAESGGDVSVMATWWYQFYFATERDQGGYEKYRRDFNKLIWQTASPKWNFDDASFDRSAASFDNPDHVSIVDPQLPLADRPGRRRVEVRRTGKATCRSARNQKVCAPVHQGIGHNLPQEAP